MVSIPCFAIASMCDASSRFANIPPCTPGCSVFTRPSSISGNPVTASTLVTAVPLASIAFALPPVDTISYPNPASPLASSFIWLLSLTLTSARFALARVATARARRVAVTAAARRPIARVRVSLEPIDANRAPGVTASATVVVVAIVLVLVAPRVRRAPSSAVARRRRRARRRFSNTIGHPGMRSSVYPNDAFIRAR